MNKYINGGIIRSMTIFYKSEDELSDILSYLQDKIDLNLFHMEKKDNSIYFDINKELFKKYFTSFLKEVKIKELYKFNSIDSNIKYLEINKDKDIYEVIKNFDDMFFDRVDFNSYSTLNNDMYSIDIDYFIFNYEGPIKLENYNSLLSMIFKLYQNSLDNPLKDALCFSVSE